MIRLLLIGPLPPPTAGTTRHFKTLVEDLSANRGFDVVAIDTSRGERHRSFVSNLASGARTIAQVVKSVRRVDIVSFHASNRAMFLFGPVVVALCRLARRPVILRIFGGSFGDYYAARGPLGRALIRRWILSADAVLLQTKRAIGQLHGVGRGALMFFSTYIRPPRDPAGASIAAARERCARFVYLGHLWRAKGIETILDASASLPGDATIDVYGPQDEYSGTEIDGRGLGRVRYGGLLSEEEVDARLWHYDCLVLPTRHPSEGYPGVIAEAFAHGIPVITTRWLAIPEIVDESCGVLVEPDDTRAFVAAISALHGDPERWRRLKAGACARAQAFDHGVWSRRFEEICGDLVA
jgi:glycosyltransferase involved in cell wall biosynthesis